MLRFSLFFALASPLSEMVSDSEYPSNSEVVSVEASPESPETEARPVTDNRRDPA